jgi:hypothetical protein
MGRLRKNRSDAVHNRVRSATGSQRARGLHAHLRVLDDLVEVWFGIIERRAIHRGIGYVKHLNAKIGAFIDGWNDRCHPFVRTKTADAILKKADRQNLQFRASAIRALRLCSSSAPRS